MAGKVGSFITSSIGTMRVTEQIDALEVMGVNLLIISFSKNSGDDTLSVCNFNCNVSWYSGE